MQHDNENKKKTLIKNDQSLSGPSAEIRTRGLLNPIQARYQLRYTRILDAVKKVSFSQCFVIIRAESSFVNHNFRKVESFLTGRAERDKVCVN